MPSGNLFIRISDSFNPDVYDRSDPPQTAINYQSADYIAANEINMWMGNDGMNSQNPINRWTWILIGQVVKMQQFLQSLQMVLVWGGKVNGEIRVNGDTYRYGLTSRLYSAFRSSIRSA